MRKIASDFDNPIDNLLIEISECVSPLLYSLCITPNMITIASLIIGLYAAYLITRKRHNKILIVSLIFVSYWLDCLDGFHARKYNLTSDFGDILDHVCDFIKFVGFMAALYYKNKRVFWWSLPVSFLMIIAIGVHLGCQEQLYDTAESHTLHLLKKLCPNPEWITVTKLFGCGTFALYECLLVWLS